MLRLEGPPRRDGRDRGGTQLGPALKEVSVGVIGTLEHQVLICEILFTQGGKDAGLHQPD